MSQHEFWRSRFLNYICIGVNRVSAHTASQFAREIHLTRGFFHSVSPIFLLPSCLADWPMASSPFIFPESYPPLEVLLNLFLLIGLSTLYCMNHSNTFWHSVQIAYKKEIWFKKDTFWWSTPQNSRAALTLSWRWVSFKITPVLGITTLPTSVSKSSS